jgi:flagellar hook-basal body complex protein FliE
LGNGLGDKKEKTTKTKDLRKPLCEVLSSYYLQKDNEKEKTQAISTKEAQKHMDEAETSYKSVMEMQKKLVKAYEGLLDTQE